MLKKWTRIVAFLLILITIWIYLSFRFRPDGLHPVFHEPDNTLDVVMVGSSAWYTFWSPMAAYESVGITSFDYAQGGMPADFLEYCIREVTKSQSPQVVAIDARVFVYRDGSTVQLDEEGKQFIEDGHIRVVSDTMPYSWNRFRMVHSVRKYMDDELSRQLDLLFYHDRWKEVLTKGGMSRYADAGRDITKGFDYHGESVSFAPPADCSGITELEPLPEETADILRSLCEYCQKQDFKTIFVAIPTAAHGEREQRQYNYMEQVIDGYSRIDFLNTNDEIGAIGIDFATDFYDSTHANYSGCVKFTGYLEEYLVSRYGLPDRRGQAGYGHWQEDLKAWRQLLEAMGR